MALAPGFPHDNFQVEITGKIAIHEGGEYTFKTASDDGSKLFINN